MRFGLRTDKEQLSIIARAPFEVYYEGPADSLSATNRIGDFDILPGHADFFSVLEPGEIIIETGKEPVKFYASNGMVTVRNNEVMLFANI
jgi:F0F1-type ATP synthase epsilon subunit